MTTYPCSDACLGMKQDRRGPALGVAGEHPDVDLEAGREVGGPEAGDVPRPVAVHHVVRQPPHLHVERLLQATVEARVTNHADADQGLVGDVTMMRSLWNS